MNYAVIDSNGVVLNTVVCDDISGWSPPLGTTAVSSDGTAAIGGTYSNGTFTPPIENTPSSTP